MMKGFFSYIFSCTNVDNHKVINILGIKLKFKRKQMDISCTGGGESYFELNNFIWCAAFNIYSIFT